jgi:FAD synthase
VAALGRELGYDVVVVPPFNLDGRPVSSSEIRRSIEAGDLDAAERLLGRPYSIVGAARVGDPEGGIALAVPMPVALPPDGSYAARLAVGRRPPIEVRALVLHGGIRITGADLVADARTTVTFSPG